MDFLPLTAAQRAQFDSEGYLIVRNAIDADTVQRLIEVSDRLIASNRTEDRQTSSTGRHDGYRNCIALDDAFVPLLTHPRTVPLIVQLLGPNIHLVTSHLIYKHPDPAGTPATYREPGWHRDIAGTPEDLGHAHVPRMEMKCAYYLTDLSEPGCGATLVSPGSNHLKEDLRIPAGKADPEKVLEPSIQPGDALFFENRTFHAGGVNLCGRTRKAVMFGYGYRWLKPFDYISQPGRLLEQVDDAGRQLLGASCGPDGRFVPGGGAEPLRAWCKKHCM